MAYQLLRKKLDEESATAVLMANLKGAKEKSSDWVEIAKASRFLMSRWGIKKMASYFKVSEFLLRQIDRINELDPATKRLVRDKRIGLEIAYHLSRVDGNRQAQAAKATLDLSMREMRQFIHLLLRDQELSVDGAKKMVEQSRTQKINVIMLPLTSETYSRIKQEAAKSHRNIHDFILKTLEDYISDKRR